MNSLQPLQTELIAALQTLYDMQSLAPLMEFCQGEMRVLFYLLSHEDEKIYPSHLSDALGVTRQRITSVLSGMRKKDLIRMEIEEQDRRRMSVSLTEKGRIEALEKQQNAYRYLEQMMLLLGEEDSRELVRLMHRCTELVQTPILKGDPTHEF